jgi:hypothetical protein
MKLSYRIFADEFADSHGQPSEGVLTLQYEYTNSGNFEEACSLFAE